MTLSSHMQWRRGRNKIPNSGRNTKPQKMFGLQRHQRQRNSLRPPPPRPKVHPWHPELTMPSPPIASESASRFIFQICEKAITTIIVTNVEEWLEHPCRSRLPPLQDVPLDDHAHLSKYIIRVVDGTMVVSVHINTIHAFEQWVRVGLLW